MWWEFAALWIRPGQNEALDAYFRQVLPIARRNGLRPIIPLSAVYSYKGNFLPDISALSLWGTLDNFRTFAREARPFFTQRDAALERLEVTHAKVRFEGEG
jgi:hypothetical protein